MLPNSTDIVRGSVSFENRLIDDFVALKSDGFPTYHLANVVDDHHMEITHVLRADEWLSSAPRHVQLYRALDWEPPRFAHLPIILAPDRSKLSKRHGATSILEYRRTGYLPEAMVNFLSLLGWSLDDKTDLIAKEELIQSFTLDRVGRAGAVFNTEKLDWMNGTYIRMLTPEQFVDALLEHWRNVPPEEIPEVPDSAQMATIVPLVQDRVKTLDEVAPLIPFLFVSEVAYEASELVQKGMDVSGTKAMLEVASSHLAELSSFERESIEGLLRPLALDLDVKVGQLLGTLRVATTGLRVSPPIFETLEALGQDRAVESIRTAIARL